MLSFLISALILSSLASLSHSVPPTAACPNPINVEYGTGCLCTAESCGTFPITAKARPGEAVVITTSPQDGFLNHQAVSLQNSTEGGSNPDSYATMKITVHSDQSKQEILGFGAAVTDAVAYVLTQVLQDNNLVDQLLTQAFVHANFSFSRVPMNGADFSRRDYALAHKLDLSDFCLRDDRVAEGEPLICGNDYKLDVLQKIRALQPDLKVYISAWSASPEWKHQNMTCFLHRAVINCIPGDTSIMECVRTVTDPNACIGQPQGVPCNTTPLHNYSEGFPLSDTLSSNYNPSNIPHKNSDGNCYHQGFIREDAYSAWAGLYAKFIQAYTNESVPIWGITAQNEPLTQSGLWQSNFWTANQLVKFINDYLSPTVRAIQPDIQIMTYDDQYTNLTNFAKDVAEETNETTNGIAFHWYQSLESIYENDKPAPAVPLGSFPLVGGGAGVQTLYDAFDGNKFLLMSESCSGYALGTAYVGPHHGSWSYGYNTAHDMLWNLRNGAAGYVYWNLVLTSIGGPNLAGNYVDSPFYAVNESAFVQNPSFFYMAHFSRAIPPGSVAVQADVECGARENEYCQYVAFRTKEGIVVVMTNDEVTTDIIAPLPLPRLAKGEGAPLQWTIRCADSVLTGVLPWKGIQTVIMPCDSSRAGTFSSRRAIFASFVFLFVMSYHWYG